MSEEIKNMLEEQNKAFAEFKVANDENIKKRDSLLEEKINKISAHLDTFEPMNQKIVLAEQQAKAVQDQLDKLEQAFNRPFAPGADPKAEDAEYRSAFERIIRRASDARDPKDLQFVRDRMNALVKADDAGAGYLLAPPDMQMDIVKDIVEMTPMRSLATVRTIGTGSLKQPRKTGTGSATRVGETSARANTGDPAYGMIEIHAPEMFARIEVSQQMLEDSGYDLMAELREDASEQFSVKEGNEYINGLGAANQAEGVLVNGEVATVVTGLASSIKADAIMDLFYGLKTGYARTAVFGLNRSTLAAVRKLKAGDGSYLWQPGIAGSVPNTILGANYVEMPDMPNIGSDTYPIVFGDFRRGYVIVDRIAISFQVDYTTGADNGLVVFRARRRVGGGVRQPDAIKKLKCAVS